MTRLIRVLFVLLLVTGVQAQVALNWQNPSPMGTDFADVQYVSATKAYAISTGSNFLTSLDGGLTWNIKNLAKESGWNFKQMVFTDENNGWIVGFVSSSGIALKTSDGGKTWTQLTLPSSVIPQAIAVRSSNLAYIACDAGKLLKTTNGGTSWQTLSSGITTKIVAIGFTSDLNGILLSGAMIRRTTDGGTTWNTISSASSSLTTLTFVNATTGFCAGMSATLYKTTDAGTSWVLQTGASTSANYVDIQFLDENNGFILRDAASSSASVYKTTNGGTSWQNAMMNNPQVGATCFWFTSATSGMVFGRKGAVSKTTDGTANWTTVSTGQRFHVKDIFFVDKNNGWFVAHDNGGSAVARTTNGGAVWELSTASIFKPYAVYFVNKNYGWISGDGGVIYKSTNGGVTWLSQTAPTAGDHMYDIYFIDTLRGWCAGSNRIMRTVDGGNTWLQVLYGVSYAGGNSIAFFDSLTGIKDTYEKNRTTDGGVTWINTPGFYSQCKFSKAGGKVVWAISYNGCKRSVDGGLTWSLESRYPLTAYAGAAVDSMICYVAGSNGTMLKTTDAGGSWVPTITGTNVEMDAMAIAENEVWVGGYNGSVLSTLSNPNGIFTEKAVTGAPKQFALQQNYPNPFNPSTKIQYAMQTGAQVRVEVYDQLGKLVTTLVNAYQSEGQYEINFEGNGLASGIYYYRLHAGSYFETKKMILIR